MGSAAIESTWTAPVEHWEREPGRPAEPENDPFYDAPLGWQAAPHGSILRSRDVGIAFLGLVPLRAKAVQLLYRTEDMHRAPTTTVTTVLLADGAEPQQDRPLVSYQCAIDALAREAFPSYTLQRGAPITGEVVQLELLLIANALAKGWAVSVPDHEGQHGDWGAPRESGSCALDGIRAALQHNDFGLTEQSPVALWGYSGGGWGTSWAAEMADDYAPELNIAGAVLGSPVGDPEGVFRRANGHMFAGLAGLVIASLVRIYPSMRAIVDTHVNDEGRELIDRATEMSTAQAVTKLAFTDFGKHLDIPVEAFLDLPEMQEIFADIRPGMGTPAMPLLILQAVRDQIVPVAGIDQMVEGFVRRGAQVTYLRDGLSEHFTLHIFSGPTVLGWLGDRFEGLPLPAPSTSTVRTVLSSVSHLRSGLRMLEVCGRVFTGRGLIPGRS
ncbi:lipase family protein [Luteipulveratus mongoliensis]|uniref:Lipase n=1 Tax=Luteipulveratus mongoliensis TaxID=571913 RepID=A0A0K1JGK3_9MICO|nr:lipase family protein [Luteipulveratus mongoliensis]AKU15852.1 hypothetical protein VV02_08290 [Luteipulveratus mongoliensis]